MSKVNLVNDFPYTTIQKWLYDSFCWCKPETLSEVEWANCLHRNQEFMLFMLEEILKRMNDEMRKGDEANFFCRSLEDIQGQFNDQKKEDCGCDKKKKKT